MEVFAGAQFLAQWVLIFFKLDTLSANISIYINIVHTWRCLQEHILGLWNADLHQYWHIVCQYSYVKTLCTHGDVCRNTYWACWVLILINLGTLSANMPMQKQSADMERLAGTHTRACWMLSFTYLGTLPIYLYINIVHTWRCLQEHLLGLQGCVKAQLGLSHILH